MTKSASKPKDSFYEITSLSIKDLEACLVLDEIVFNGMWTRSQWEKELEDSKRICLGYFVDSELFAYSCAWLIIDELHLTALAVHPNKRRKGLGIKIMYNLFNLAKDKGSLSVTLEVSNLNKGAKAFYKKLGFKITGYRKNYYKDGSDAAIHWLNINKQ